MGENLTAALGRKVRSTHSCMLTTDLAATNTRSRRATIWWGAGLLHAADGAE